ncbi:hypothetical protein QTO34_000012 [Cnephaeus nilssonii]|uniref:Uncharacterized protein n=1 Tax=Cnephaeus nilssonii TaxID=3371016 RepID=A0AA40IAM2_CNENI|nr:hypothetical protein QTO34_000012 [Eptesicus nilssonii]
MDTFRSMHSDDGFGMLCSALCSTTAWSVFRSLYYYRCQRVHAFYARLERLGHRADVAVADGRQQELGYFQGIEPGKSSLSPPGGIMLFKTRPGILESWVKHQAGGRRGFENGITMRQDSINGLMRDHTIQVHDYVKEENLYTGRVLPLKRALALSVQGFYLKEVICGETAHCSQALETRQGTEDCQLRSGLRRDKRPDRESNSNLLVHRTTLNQLSPTGSGWNITVPNPVVGKLRLSSHMRLFGPLRVHGVLCQALPDLLRLRGAQPQLAVLQQKPGTTTRNTTSHQSSITVTPKCYRSVPNPLPPPNQEAASILVLDPLAPDQLGSLYGLVYLRAMQKSFKSPSNQHTRPNANSSLAGLHAPNPGTLCDSSRRLFHLFRKNSDSRASTVSRSKMHQTHFEFPLGTPIRNTFGFHRI